MKRTKIVRYRIVTCTGDLLKEVSLRIPAGASGYDYTHKAILKAGFRQHVCEQCYDNAYSADIVS